MLEGWLCPSSSGLQNTDVHPLTYHFNTDFLNTHYVLGQKLSHGPLNGRSYIPKEKI